MAAAAAERSLADTAVAVKVETAEPSDIDGGDPRPADKTEGTAVAASDSVSGDPGCGNGEAADASASATASLGKAEKILDIVQQSASDEAKKKIDQILTGIKQLSDLEKLLLYLKLPTGTNVEVDPLKQNCISSLGSRFEVTQTVIWIKTHLEEDPEVSLPKQDVYDGYNEFCQTVKMKALSAADFGKVMKQVFPGVRPRRLGTRGNSRYCYAGLKKKHTIAAPQLPDLSIVHSPAQEEISSEGNAADMEMLSVASCLIREWAEKLLNAKFQTLKDLARHLVEFSYVDNRSVAAFTAVSCLSGTSESKGNQAICILNPSGGGKHRETQLQLQRKLQEKELIREQKKRLQAQKSLIGQIQPGEKTCARNVTARKSQVLRSHTTESNSKLSGVSENGYHEQNQDLRTTTSASSFPPDRLTTAQKPVQLRSGSEILCRERCTTARGLSLERHARTPSGSQNLHTSPVPVARMVSKLSAGEYSSDASLGNSMGSVPGSLSPTKVPSAASTEETTSATVIGLEPGRARKVPIPRVSGTQGSKMCLPSFPLLIIQPNLADCVSSQARSTTKYKPIQPKPSSSCTGTSAAAESPSSSDERAGADWTSARRVLASPPARSAASIGRCADGVHESFASSETVPGESETTSARESLGSDVGRTEPSKSLASGQKRPSEKSLLHTKRMKLQTDHDRFRSQCKSEPVSRSPSVGDLAGPVRDLAPKLVRDSSSEEEVNISNLEKDAIIEFFNGSSHAEQDEELAQYFGAPKAISTEMMSDGSTPVRTPETHSAQISQLRRLLERNLQKKGTRCGLMDGAPDEPPASTLANDNPVLRQLLKGSRDQPLGSSPPDFALAADDESISVMNPEVGSPLPPFNRLSVKAAGMYAEYDSSSMGAGEHDGGVEMSVGVGQYGAMPSSEDIDDVRFLGTEGVSYLPTIGAFGHQDFPEEAGDTFDAAEVESEDQMMESLGAYDPLDAKNPMVEGVFFGEPQKPNSPYSEPATPAPAATSLPTSTSCGGHSSVPPSPNTRRRAFNFMPISPQSTPGPDHLTSHSSSSHSPFQPSGPSSCTYGASHLGVKVANVSSQPPSATTSPFVSPRSTPSSHCRSRHNSGQATTSSAYGTPRGTPLAPTIAHGVEMVAAATVCSPFVSPHPTPAPLCRSRHNSNQNLGRSASSFAGQQQVARSRHPSEMGGFPQMSPASAPMSPIEYSQVDPDPFLGNFGDAPQIRSRHSSNSSVTPHSPRSAPMSPKVSLGPLMPSALLDAGAEDPPSFVNAVAEGSAGSKTLVAIRGSLDLGDPEPHPRHYPSPGLVQSPLSQWQGGQRGFSGVYADPDQPSSRSLGHRRSLSTWPLSKPMSAPDPRLSSRQRHASHGSAAHGGYAAAGLNVGGSPASWLDPMAQEVSGYLQKPLPSLLGLDPHRSQSVPLYQMVCNMEQQAKQSQSAFQHDTLSKSFPATPNAEQTFHFQGDIGGEFGMGEHGLHNDGGSSLPEPTPVCDQFSFRVTDGRVDGEGHEPIQDSLQATLDDLCACDKDFSKFSQDF